MLTIEVVYALPQKQTMQRLTLPDGATVQEAIQQSALLTQYPSIDLTQQAVGIWGHVVTLETPLKMNDRVEIYRPLATDPKTKRRLSHI